jgi:hypothetical protein
MSDKNDRYHSLDQLSEITQILTLINSCDNAVHSLPLTYIFSFVQISFFY